MATRLMILLLALPLGPALGLTARTVPDREQPPVRLSLRAQIARQRQVFVERLGVLETDYAETTDPAQALELQRRISRLKLEHEIILHRLQLAELSSKGESESMKRLAAAIEALEQMLTQIAPGDDEKPEEAAQ